jgi:DNA-binding MarR family transcriptional regulator
LVELLADYIAELEADFDGVSIPRVVELLGRLVESAQDVDEFVEKPTFTFARNFEYQDPTPSLLWVRRHLITLGAYRDDSHIASWKELGLPGHTWEAFTFVWQEQGHTAAELAEKLTFRGFEEEEYAQALETLANLGWVESKDGQYSVTEKGRQQRELAEEKTNQYYKAAFGVLTQNELKEVIELINRLTEALTPEEEAQSA